MVAGKRSTMLVQVDLTKRRHVFASQLCLARHQSDHDCEQEITECPRDLIMTFCLRRDLKSTICIKVIFCFPLNLSSLSRSLLDFGHLRESGKSCHVRSKLLSWYAAHLSARNCKTTTQKERTAFPAPKWQNSLRVHDFAKEINEFTL